MAKSGYTGISFPFRISSKGGVVMSTTSSTDPQHIVESVIQIYSTNFLERPMEPSFFSRVSNFLFEPNDISLQQMLKVQMVEDLNRLDPRVETSEDDIKFEVVVDGDGISYLYATVTFKIVKYSTTYTAKIKVGAVKK